MKFMRCITASIMTTSRFPSSRVVALSNSVPQREFIEEQARSWTVLQYRTRRELDCLAVQDQEGIGLSGSTVSGGEGKFHVTCKAGQYHAMQYNNIQCSTA